MTTQSAQTTLRRLPGQVLQSIITQESQVSLRGYLPKHFTNPTDKVTMFVESS